jgi:hypothetical protein
VFSDSYAEHQKNVARLRGIEHTNGNGHVPMAPPTPSTPPANAIPNSNKP